MYTFKPVRRRVIAVVFIAIVFIFTMAGLITLWVRNRLYGSTRFVNFHMKKAQKLAEMDAARSPERWGV
jgi:hypothetical protein